MSFDFGLNRIGIAISNTELKIPHPVAVVTGRNKFEKLDKIAKLIQEWKPSHLVVGMPSESRGATEATGATELATSTEATGVTKETKQLKDALIDAINKFANRLKHKFKLPLTFVNEDYTSQIASNKLTEQLIRGRRQVGKLDMLAACAILQRYLDTL